MKIIKIIAAGNVWEPKTAEEERTFAIEALCQTNTAIELRGGSLTLSIQVRDEEKDKTYQSDIAIDRLSEMEEVFNRGTLNPEIRTEVLQRLKPRTRFPEKPRRQGMSWVHMGVKEGEDLIGWVTACVVPEGNGSIKVGFAFCRKDNCFSKRLGRIMSRKRLDAGQFATLVCNTDRYSSVKSFVMNYAAGRQPTNCINSHIGNAVPNWMDPNRERRDDIPRDVVELLEEIKGNPKIDQLTRKRIDSALNKDRLPHYESWPIRE